MVSLFCYSPHGPEGGEAPNLAGTPKPNPHWSATVRGRKLHKCSCATGLNHVAVVCACSVAFSQRIRVMARGGPDPDTGTGCRLHASTDEAGLSLVKAAKTFQLVESVDEIHQHIALFGDKMCTSQKFKMKTKTQGGDPESRLIDQNSLFPSEL